MRRVMVSNRASRKSRNSVASPPPETTRVI